MTKPKGKPKNYEARSEGQVKLDMEHGFGSAGVNYKAIAGVLHDVVGNADNTPEEDRGVYAEVAIKAYVAGYTAALADARHNP